MNIIPTNSQSTQINNKMSSLEIAELTNKLHKNVMRDIKELIDNGAIGGLNFELTSYKSDQNKELPMYELDFPATMVLITGYDARRRSLVVNRWLALETGEAEPMMTREKDINLKEFEVQMIGAKYISEMLNYSEMSKLELTHKIYKDRGLSTKALPEYLPNQKPVFAISDLLSKAGLGNVAQKINKQLVSLGILEEKSRRSTKNPDKIKKFKMLTEKGLLYGRNDSSVQNKNEVQPKYYEDKFSDLLSLLGINQKEATA